MRSPSFRIKILLSMLAIVVGVTGATLYVSQRTYQSDHRQRFNELFQLQSDLFSNQQHWAMNELRQQLAILVKKQRVQLALLESDVATLYEQVGDEMVVRGLLPQQGEPVRANHASLFILLDPDGHPMLPPSNPVTGLRPLAEQTAFLHQLEQVGMALQHSERPVTAYLTLLNEAGELELHQAVFSRVVDNVTGENLGAFGLVSHVPDLGGGAHASARAGLFFENQLFMRDIGDNVRAGLSALLAEQIRPGGPLQNEPMIKIEGEPFRVLYQPLPQDPDLPEAWLVALVSMADALAVERGLRQTFLYLGAAGLLLALLLSWLMSNSLSGPIRDLVRGTTAIQAGDFEYRVPIRSSDEIGTLGTSFNEMAEGLGQREKLHNILNLVADKEVANQMLEGSVALGGELRELSVLFCDIRGFTALTDGMDPAEVIRLLNEHFTPLTRVVYENHGVVDKFVGDLIMAVFGAPKSYGDDALNAARCALAMIEERNKLNLVSAHDIKVGIGLATGPAVAGCVGASERLNYTVLGDRVNLASRLCGRARRMEVVIDETTRVKIQDQLPSRSLGFMELKGFAAPVEAFLLLASETETRIT